MSNEKNGIVSVSVEDAKCINAALTFFIKYANVTVQEVTRATRIHTDLKRIIQNYDTYNETGP